MNKVYIIFGFLFLFALNACEKLGFVNVPEFDVSVDSTTYKIGEKVVFTFKGNPDLITVYTGDVGNDVDFNTGRYINSSLEAKFDMQMLDGKQDNQVDILLSTDFDGDYSIAGVEKASWKIVNNRFRILKPQETRSYVSSGWGDITDILGDKENVQFYIAIRNTTRNQSVYGLGSLIRLRDFIIEAKNNLGSTTMENHSSLNWKLFSSENKETDRAALKENFIELRSNTKNNGYEDSTVDWVVSKQLSFEKFTNLGPDWGKVVKGVNSQRVDRYIYTFTTPGIHRVTFVAINMNKDHEKKVVKEIRLKIEP